MAGLATEDFNSALKVLYLGPLNDLTYRKHVMLNRLEKNKHDVSGSYAHVPLISGRNPAVGGRADPASGTVGAKLPMAGRQTYSHATYTMGLHYGRGSISGSVKRKSRTNAGAFAKAIDEEHKGLMKSLPDDLNRQICGMGNGRAATLVSGSQATSIEIECDARDPFTMRVGDRVHTADITAGPATDVDPTAGTTVSSIVYFTDNAGNRDINKHTVTLAAATGGSVTASADAFYFGAVASGVTLVNEDSSWAQDIYGIQALIDDGDIGADLQVVAENTEILSGPGGTGDVSKVGGIERSNAFWQAIVKHNPNGAGTKRPLNFSVIEEAWITATMLNGAVGSEIEGYCHPSIWGTLGSVQVGQRIYNDFRKKVEYGFEAIEVNGSLVFADRDLPLNELFFLHMPSIFLLTQNDYEYLDDDGSIIRVAAGGNRDAWEFTLNRDVQCGIRAARKHVRVRDLTSNMETMTQLH